VVLVHGITSSSASWEEVAPILARRHTVLAPDLLGHGQSAKPRRDYSMGAFASGSRDLAVGRCLRGTRPAERCASVARRLSALQSLA
jgi:pimeloyl-ACP methyl ester carboxylesterase